MVLEITLWHRALVVDTDKGWKRRSCGHDKEKPDYDYFSFSFLREGLLLRVVVGH